MEVSAGMGSPGSKRQDKSAKHKKKKRHSSKGKRPASGASSSGGSAGVPAGGNWAKMQAKLGGGARAAAGAGGSGNWERLQAKQKKSKHVKRGRDASERPRSKAKRKKSRGRSADSGAASAAEPTTAALSRAPQPFVYSGAKKFLSPEDGAFAECHRVAYGGFHRDSAAALPARLHVDVKDALERMRAAGLFTHDVVSAGRAVSATFVERTLVGDAGMSYFYQRLRIFAYPWEDEWTEPSSPLRVIRALNEALKRRAAEVQRSVTHTLGSNQFNITLINRMFSDAESDKHVPLKEESVFGMGKASVSWHADSSLQDSSTIGVYHQTSGPPDAQDWRVGMRLTTKGGESTPAICVPLKNYETYFMTGDFNATHQHCVLVGDTTRYSSTHRVAIVGKDTLAYAKRQAALGIEAATRLARAHDAGDNAAACHADDLRKVGEIAIELEFDWIRMFWVAGQAQADSHSAYWLPAIEQLEEQWRVLQAALAMAVLAAGELADSAEVKTAGNLTRSFDMLLYLLGDLWTRRVDWDKRLKSPAYARLPRSCRPVDRPLCDERVSGLPRDTRPVTRRVKALKERYVQRAGGNSHGRIAHETVQGGGGSGRGRKGGGKGSRMRR